MFMCCEGFLMRQWLAGCVVPACLAVVAVPTSLALMETAAVAAPANQWQTVKGRGFSIQMPGKPEVMTTQESVDGDTVPTTAYQVHLPNHTGYMVTVTDLPVSFDPNSKIAKKILDEGMRESVKKHQAKVVSKQSLTLGGYPGREVTLRDSNASGKLRMFLVKDKIFSVMSAGDAKQLSQQNVDRFFRSFKLAN
jgi:hypothetical protein